MNKTKMKIKIILCLLILVTLFSGCVTTSTDGTIGDPNYIKNGSSSYKLSPDGFCQVCG